MRRILVLLIFFLLIGPAVGAWARDLFWVRVLSVDRATNQVIVKIIGGDEARDDQPGDGEVDAAPEMAIVSEAMVKNFKPGDVARVWGSVSENGRELVIDDAASLSGPGSEPTGVRRRLRNKGNHHGSGAGHGRQ